VVLGDGGCDGVVKQAPLRDERRASLLWQLGEQGVEQCPEAAGNLVLPGAEGADFIEAEFDEVVLGRGWVDEPDRAMAIGDDPDGQVLCRRVAEQVFDAVQ
jgi:hypothetical protein